MEPNQLGRLEDMKEFLREDAETLRRERRKKADAIYADRGQVIKNDLETVLKGLADGKGDGRLVISCLKSSYITGSFDFYIAFYAGEPFVEEEPDSAYYSMAVLLDGIGEDLERMGKKLRGKFIRVMSSETEEIRRWYMEGFHGEWQGIFREILEGIGEEKHVDVLFGGYMDRLETVGRV